LLQFGGVDTGFQLFVRSFTCGADCFGQRLAIA
jgi:hypothetical protein